MLSHKHGTWRTGHAFSECQGAGRFGWDDLPGRFNDHIFVFGNPFRQGLSFCPSFLPWSRPVDALCSFVVAVKMVSTCVTVERSGSPHFLPTVGVSGVVPGGLGRVFGPFMVPLGRVEPPRAAGSPMAAGLLACLLLEKSAQLPEKGAWAPIRS